MSKIKFLIGFIFILLFAILSVGCKDKISETSNGNTTGKLRITLLSVRHGDAILIQDGKRNVMVDVGHSDNRNILLSKLEEKGIEKIDCIFLTHHHQDHIGNIFPVAKKYKAGIIYDNGLVNENYQTSIRLKEVFKDKKLNNKILQAGDVIKFSDDYWLEVMAPGKFMRPKLLQDLNNSSLVMKLHYKNFTMLLTGDIEKQTEGTLVKQYGDKLKADVLKIAHHGSRTSSIYNFVTTVKPKYAVISCGDRAKYNHPHKNTTGMLKHLEIPFYNTEDNGDIIIETDGNKMDVKAQKS